MTQAKTRTARSPAARKASAGAPADNRLTREQACAALTITPELLADLERSGALAPDGDGRFDPLAVAAAAVRFGLHQAEAADVKLVKVGAALTDVKPALERLAVLADRADLSGDAHTRVMVEVAAFFNAFAEVMIRAPAALKAEGDGEG